jgi:hypothetical protein
MQFPEELTLEKIDKPFAECSPPHPQSAQLDRVSRVCISTIQRLYSMLRRFFFRIETRMPQGQMTRGDRQSVLRIQRSVWNGLGNALAS